MSPSEFSKKMLVEPEFCWGEKIGSDGNIELYGSFVYDEVHYALNDFVYVYDARREDNPHIGKLLRIWESASKCKMIKIRWLFRASEITYWLKAHSINALDKEEAICGKCRAACISRDRTSLPEDADYVLFRTFDVGNYMISDLDDVVGGIQGALEPVHGVRLKDLPFKKRRELQ